MEESTEGEAQLNALEHPFKAFVEREGTRLRRALVASYGVEVGSDAAADALAWAWEHWPRLNETANPVGYLFRVGQSSARRQRRQRRRFAFPSEVGTPEVGEMSVRLDEALTGLPTRQRAVAILVHGHGYSYAEVAEMTASSVAAVRSDLHRAMKRLRKQLEM